MLLSLVVPCYNEEEVIAATHHCLLSLCQSWVERKIIQNFHLLYINDGSHDDTAMILSKLAHHDARVKVISFSTNFGHQAAITAGIRNAEGDAIVCLDADLQDPPEIIEAMIDKFQDGCDIVYGVRDSRAFDSYFKRLSAEWYYRMIKWMGVKIVFNHADFRLVSRRVAEAFEQYSEVNLFLRGIFPAIGFKEGFVTYERKARRSGKTKYPLKKMLAFAVEGITSFSWFPLRLIFILGFIFFLGSLALILWALMTKINGGALPGWASIVIPIYFFGGVNLISIGIIGEYIGKIYTEVKRRPLFIIDYTLNLDQKTTHIRPMKSKDNINLSLDHNVHVSK